MKILFYAAVYERKAEFPFCISANLPFMCVSSDNFVRENPCSWQQLPSVQEKSLTGCLLCCTVCHCVPEWSFVVWKRISWPGLLTYLFIYLFNKPFSNGCCHRRLPGLSRGNIRVFVDSAGAFWDGLIGFFPSFSVHVQVLLSTINTAQPDVLHLCTHINICASIHSSFHLYFHFSITSSLYTSLCFLCPSVSASSGSLFLFPLRESFLLPLSYSHLLLFHFSCLAYVLM